MGAIHKRELPSGTRYYVRYKTPSGKWKWEIGGARKKDAEALLSRREASIANGSYGRQGDSPVTFEEYARLFLANLKGRVKPLTYADYENVLRVHLVPVLGKKYLRNITAGDCKQLISAKAEEGKAPRTVSQHRCWDHMRQIPHGDAISTPPAHAQVKVDS